MIVIEFYLEVNREETVMSNLNEKMDEHIDEEEVIIEEAIEDDEIETSVGSDLSNKNVTLGILNEKIGALRAAAKALVDVGDRDPDKIEGLYYDVFKYLYDVYMDDTAYIYVPYLGRMPKMMIDEESGPGFLVFTLPKEQLPELEYPEVYKKELFREIADLVYSHIEHFWICLNPETYYTFTVGDVNLEYIMARKNGAESFPLMGEDDSIYGYLKW